MKMNMDTVVRENLVDHLPKIRGIIYKITLNEDVIDDVTQEVCVRIIEKEKLWSRNTSTLKQWMNTITRNVVRRKISKQSREKFYNQTLQEEVLESSVSEEFSEEKIKWALQKNSTFHNQQSHNTSPRLFQSSKGRPDGTKITDEGVEVLKEALPKCKFIR